jgi:phage terminase large subunit GpA-like protein
MSLEYIPCTIRAWYYRAWAVVRQEGRAIACQDCGCTQKLQVHHVDLNPCNNSPDNLRILCVSCHKAIHPERLNFEHVRGVCA